MPMMEIYRNTVICVDRCENETIQGRVIHPYLKNEEPFRSTRELLYLLKSTFS